MTAAPPGPVASVGVEGGVAEIVGLPVSVTTTLKLVVAGPLPTASDAEQFTGVVPIKNEEPDAGEQLTATLPSTMSCAVGGVYDTVAELVAVDPVVLLAGAVNVGGVVSTTVTVNVVTIEGSLSSVQVTVVAPRLKWEFGAGSQLVPGSGVKSTFVPVESVASAVMSPL